MTEIASQLLRSVVYGAPEVDLDDPAETYHEASKLHPALEQRQSGGIARLAQSSVLQAAALRAPRRNRQLPTVALAEPRPPDASLWSALHARRSVAPAGRRALGLPALTTVLAGGYGPAGNGRRTAPSGGALYPLELYVVAQRVEGLEPGVFHVDLPRGVLEIVSEGPVSESLAAACALPELVVDAAAVVVVTAVFWRTRFKYGLRGYRFALLEAGHVAQNVVLVAAGLGVTALPLGGFYDSLLDELLGADGVDESVVHAVVLGGDPA